MTVAAECGLVLVGAGGFGRETAEAVRALKAAGGGWRVGGGGGRGRGGLMGGPLRRGLSGWAVGRNTAGASLRSAAWVSPATNGAIPPGPSDRSSRRAICSGVGARRLTSSVRPQSSSSGSSIRRVLTSAWRSPASRLEIVRVLSSRMSSASPTSQWGRRRHARPSVPVPSVGSRSPQVRTTTLASSPPTGTEPPLGESTPPRMFISVLLPDPEGPITAIHSPLSTANETPFKAATEAP